MAGKTISGIMVTLLLMSMVISAFRIQSAKAGKIVVPDDYSTIQDAINHANAGDTIFVKNGTYSGPIVIDKTLTLQGERRNATIIDGGTNEPSGSIVLVAADNVKISGFTIQHCREGGNAVWLDGYVNMTFSDNIITGNNEGVRILHSSGNVVSYNIVQDCYYNTGIGFDWAYNNTIYNNTIVNNHIGIGAGAGYGPNEESYNNTFSENTILGNDYGFYGAIYNSTFFHNNIINNAVQAAFYSGYLSYPNKWDNGFEGNYWSDYSGTDNSSPPDGIGDTPYVIDANNQDNYPLMNRYWNPSDVNHDLRVDIKDLSYTAKAYGTYLGHPRWNPRVDLNNDNRIDIKDLALIAKNYGKTYP